MSIAALDAVVALVEDAEATGDDQLAERLLAIPGVAEHRRRVDALRVVDRLVRGGLSVRSAVAFLCRSPGYPYPPSCLRKWHRERSRTKREGLFTQDLERTLGDR